MECYLLSEPKIRRYRKCMLSMLSMFKKVCFVYQNKDQLIRQILFVGIVE